MSELVSVMYAKAYDHFGPQNWWPGDTPLEIMVGAVLTQNTNWANVERAIANLKSKGPLTLQFLLNLSHEQLAEAIRPAGYLNLKAKRLRNLLVFLQQRFAGDIEQMRKISLDQLRQELLQVNGIGEETADSILLYALQKPSFVIDGYTYRILRRHAMIAKEADYIEMQNLFVDNLPSETSLYNEYHALLVAIGKNYCRPRNPLCMSCPFQGINWAEGVAVLPE